jgi:DNA-binding GntR family transcriptional regulator
MSGPLTSQAAPLQARSLSEQIADYLSEAILQGKYAPGQTIIEQEIADMFGVSRGPVREAFRILEREGVVVINPRRSINVTKLTLEEVAEIFEIRGHLFGLAARLCAERRSARSIKAIEAAYEQIEEFIPTKATAELYSNRAADATRTIIAQCGNQRLIVMLNRVSRQVHRYSLLGLSSLHRQQQSMASFAALVSAIREGRADDADDVAREMVKNTGGFAARMLSDIADE